MIGAHRKLSVKHLPAYLDEFAFRFNNCSSPYLFRDTLLVLLADEARRSTTLVQSASTS